jgi:hypothetical protein
MAVTSSSANCASDDRKFLADEAIHRSGGALGLEIGSRAHEMKDAKHVWGD